MLYEAVSLALLPTGAGDSSGSCPLPGLDGLRFVVRRRSPHVDGGAIREVERSYGELSFARSNPMLQEFPPAVVAAMLGRSGHGVPVVAR